MVFLHGQLGYLDEMAFVLGAILAGGVLLSTAVTHWQTHNSNSPVIRKLARKHAK
ncbi:MAG: hypothetical protein AAF490_06675 [Chloroflexota bacterium]